jgi:hypothetical protein
MTREEFLKDMTQTEQYYGQFVSEDLKAFIVRSIGMKKLRAAYPSMKGIDLVRWDNLAVFLRDTLEPQLRSKGDVWSIAGCVCILKIAAQQAVEDAQNRETERL